MAIIKNFLNKKNKNNKNNKKIKKFYNLNQSLFLAIFEFASQNNFIKHITKYSVLIFPNIFFILYFLGLFYMIYLFFYNNNNLISLFKYIFIPIFALIISNIMRKIINNKRPFEVFNIEPIVSHKKGNSTPSNHSTSAMVISFALVFISDLFAPFIFIFAIITGISRIMAGVHYPFDVILGLFLGAFVGKIGFFYL